MERNEPLTGIVFGIQRFSIHDGPGIRTTVFLKGCNVNCRWCHNPEGIGMQPVVGYTADKCVSCGGCAAVCPNGCHHITNTGHSFDRTQCVACGKCTEVCPVQALDLIGKRMTAGEVMQAVRKDCKYYGSDGGVTISGGEALMQKAFVLELLRRCKDENIHCALETNGVHRFETYEQVIPYVDLFLLDYKATDSDVHQAYVGCSNTLVLQNLQKLTAAGAQVLLRCPIIPGVNDNAKHFNAIAGLTKAYPRLLGAEILPYHRLGVSKAKRIDTDYQEFETVPVSVSDEWKRYILEQGGRLVNVE